MILHAANENGLHMCVCLCLQVVSVSKEALCLHCRQLFNRAAIVIIIYWFVIACWVSHSSLKSHSFPYKVIVSVQTRVDCGYTGSAARDLVILRFQFLWGCICVLHSVKLCWRESRCTTMISIKNGKYFAAWHHNKIGLWKIHVHMLLWVLFLHNKERVMPNIHVKVHSLCIYSVVAFPG